MNRSMNIIFLAPVFPLIQRRYLKALKNTGVHVTGIGKEPVSQLPSEVKVLLDDYQQVHSLDDNQAVIDGVKKVRQRRPIARLVSTYEMNILTAAQARQACGIQGLTPHQALVCRDKTAMKDFMRNNGIPCSASTAADSIDDIARFADSIGYPIIVKPRAGAGSMNTWYLHSQADLHKLAQSGTLRREPSVAVEEFIDGHEGTYDTLTVNGKIVCDFVTHYYPNPLPAQKDRRISPYCIATNRLDSAPDYQELRELGHKVNEKLGLDTDPTHMEWFFGSKGLKFSEIAARPPGSDLWDLYCVSNEIDLFQEWASGIVHGKCSDKISRLSRKYAAAIMSIRPDRDGIVKGYQGLDRLFKKYGQWIFEYDFPKPGTPTRPFDISDTANAWLKIKHPDYDVLRGILDDIGKTVKAFAG